MQIVAIISSYTNSQESMVLRTRIGEPVIGITDELSKALPHTQYNSI